MVPPAEPAGDGRVVGSPTQGQGDAIRLSVATRRSAADYTSALADHRPRLKRGLSGPDWRRRRGATRIRRDRHRLKIIVPGIGHHAILTVGGIMARWRRRSLPRHQAEAHRLGIHDLVTERRQRNGHASQQAKQKLLHVTARFASAFLSAPGQVGKPDAKHDTNFALQYEIRERFPKMGRVKSARQDVKFLIC